MTYSRDGRKRTDYHSAREFEEEVGTWLGGFKVSNLTSPDRLDYWLPGVSIEVKAKLQRLSERFLQHWPGGHEPDLFVMDELSVRKAAEHFPLSYFVLRDLPGGGRVFLARVDEMFCADRVRLNRQTTAAGPRKGKWLVNLNNFRQLSDPAEQVLPMILADIESAPWRQPECLTAAVPIPDL